MPDLDSGESIIAEAGAMNYMHDGITFDIFMAASLKPVDYCSLHKSPYGRDTR